MSQLEEAFKRVAPLEGELEEKHKSFNRFVADDIQHALFTDWPHKQVHNGLSSLWESALNAGFDVFGYFG